VQGAAKTCANSGGNAPATSLKLKFFLSGGDAAHSNAERKDSEEGAKSEIQCGIPVFVFNLSVSDCDCLPVDLSARRSQALRESARF
jgi:hypothetical protein